MDMSLSTAAIYPAVSSVLRFKFPMCSSPFIRFLVFALAVIFLQVAAPGSAHAWYLQNESPNKDFNYQVYDKGLKLIEEGDLDRNSKKSCDSDKQKCNPDGGDYSEYTVVIKSGGSTQWACSVTMLSGGFVYVYEVDNGALPDSYWCLSQIKETVNGEEYSIDWSDDYFKDNGIKEGEANFEAEDRHVRFLVTGDPQVDFRGLNKNNCNNRDRCKAKLGDDQTNYDEAVTAYDTFMEMTGLLQGTGYSHSRSHRRWNSDVRGIIVSGDLTATARWSEIKYYMQMGTADNIFKDGDIFTPKRHPWDQFIPLQEKLYEGLGNHDFVDETDKDQKDRDRCGEDLTFNEGRNNCEGWISNYVADHKRSVRRTTLPVLGGIKDAANFEPHYSWEWHDVHFVQLNTFPSDSPVSGKSHILPQGALSFLKDDLANHVGDSGRPVVLIHHYGFDTESSLDEGWWGDAELLAYWDAIADYNVIAIFTGHRHLTLGNNFSSWRKDFGKPAKTVYRPDGRVWIPSYNAAAALNGVYLDVTIDDCNLRVERMNDKGDIDTDTISFDSPGARCQTPVISELTGDEINENGVAMISGNISLPDTEAELGTFTVRVRWSDGPEQVETFGTTAINSGDVTWDPDTGDFSFEHQYLDDNPSGDVSNEKSVYVIVDTNDGFNAAETTVTVNNVAPVINLLTFDFGPTISEGGAAALEGVFSDVGSEDSFTLTIDWGDGATHKVDYPAGTTDLYAAHYYQENGEYYIAITLLDDDGGAYRDDNIGPVVVNNVAPTISNLQGDTIDENGIAMISANLSDPGDNRDDTFRLEINWGDGSALESIDLPHLGDGRFTRKHQYLDDGKNDQYTVTVRLWDDDGGMTEEKTTVFVNNVDPEIRNLKFSSTNIVENGSIRVVGSVFDVGSKDRVDLVINWGDGESDEFSYTPDLSPAAKSFDVTHTYLDDDADDEYTVTISAKDKDGGTVRSQTPVVVRNIPPQITGLNGDNINENGTATVSGTFSDPGTLDSGTLTIEWGDGDVELFSYFAGSTSFSWEHKYRDDDPSNTAQDAYKVKVTVQDKDGGFDGKIATVIVQNVAPVASIDSVIDQLTGLGISHVLDDGSTVTGAMDVILAGTAIEVAGSYTDVGTQDTHDGIINWGDSTGNDRIISPHNSQNGKTDTASHTYAADLAPGLYTIALTIRDDDLGLDTPTATIEVVDATGSLQDAQNDLQGIIDEGFAIADPQRTLNQSESVRGNAKSDDPIDILYSAMAKLISAEEKIGQGNLNAALVHVSLAVGMMADAEAVATGLDLVAAKTQLVLTAKSIAESAIEQAESIASKNNEWAKIDDAKLLRDEGDSLLGVLPPDGPDYDGALQAYTDAVRRIESIIN